MTHWSTSNKIRLVVYKEILQENGLAVDNVQSVSQDFTLTGNWLSGTKLQFKFYDTNVSLMLS